MKKVAVVKAARKRSQSPMRGGQAGQASASASASSVKKKRGAPPAFSAPQVPVEPVGSRSRLFEKYGAAARQMYVEQGLSAREISGRLSGKVAEVTIAKWMRRYSWGHAREAKLKSPEARTASVQELFDQLIETARENAKKGRLPNEKFWDQLIKGARAIERLSGEAHFAAHLTKFVEGVLKYAQSNRPDLVGELTTLLSGYSVTVLTSR